MVLVCMESPYFAFTFFYKLECEHIDTVLFESLLYDRPTLFENMEWFWSNPQAFFFEDIAN